MLLNKLKFRGKKRAQILDFASFYTFIVVFSYFYWEELSSLILIVFSSLGWLSEFEFAPVGVMVGCVDGVIDLAAKHAVSLSGQDVVDAEVHKMGVIGNAWSEGGFAIGILQVLGDDAMGIGDRRVIEVATHDDVGTVDFADAGGNDLSLRTAQRRSIRQFEQQVFTTTLDKPIFRVFEN